MQNPKEPSMVINRLNNVIFAEETDDTKLETPLDDTEDKEEEEDIEDEDEEEKEGTEEEKEEDAEEVI